LKFFKSKFFLLFVSIIISLLIAEFICSVIINFPKYGVDKYVIGTEKFRFSNIYYKPYAEYLAREIGYKKFRRNNAGLTGNDIIFNDSTIKNIYLAGSSYIEALQVNSDSIASTIFNSYLIKNNYKYQVINAGAGGHTMYDSYFRILYMNNFFKINKVIYVLDWKRMYSQNLDFKIDENFGKKDNGIILNIHNFLRNNSSFINLTSEYIKPMFKIAKKWELKENAGWTEIKEDKFLENIKLCIKEYHNKYSNDFIFFCTLNNNNIKDTLQFFCEANNINFFSDTAILTKENMIERYGHFNNRGNYLLAQDLILIFEKFINKIP
jgi:hypothetical protein